MKRWITIGILSAVLGIASAAAYAADVPPPVVPPKGIEGPDIRTKVEPKGIEGPDVRHRSREVPMGTEGSESR
ncbi:MAG: hypothetical protein ACE147_21805 [Candidatus Methylomirabilales bacterium]